jgi:hypothetical protein
MVSMKSMMLVLVPLVALGACTAGLSDQDRALLTSASQNAEQAKQQSAQALAAAQNAQQQAQAAEADAKAANEKSDRMFQKSLRK